MNKEGVELDGSYYRITYEMEHIGFTGEIRHRTNVLTKVTKDELKKWRKDPGHLKIEKVVRIRPQVSIRVALLRASAAKEIANVTLWFKPVYWPNDAWLCLYENQIYGTGFGNKSSVHLSADALAGLFVVYTPKEAKKRGVKGSGLYEIEELSTEELQRDPHLESILSEKSKPALAQAMGDVLRERREAVVEQDPYLEGIMEKVKDT